MTREEAIKIIDYECEHIKHHLTDKGKAEEFYIELGNMVIAFEMAIRALEPTYDKLSFPKTFDELVEQYGIIDTDEVYTNGLKLIPAFRVKQWLMEANINGYTEGLKDSSKSETVTEFADRCRECGAKYGKLLEQKWIPISEISPNDGEWAIFTDGTQISIERYKMDTLDHFFPSGRWFDLEDAVAWMPLPKPYKPQESEE